MNVVGTEHDADGSIGMQANDLLRREHFMMIDLDHFSDRQGFDTNHLEDQQNVVICLRRIVALSVSPLYGRFQAEPWGRIPMTL